MTMFGISLAAVVTAVGFVWLGNTIAKGKRVGKGGLNVWAGFVFYLLAGMAGAVAVWPIAGWLASWTVVAVLATFAFLALTIAGSLDIAADKQPDRFAMTAAKFSPVLGLIAASSWGTFTSVVGNQVSAYMSHLGG